MDRRHGARYRATPRGAPARPSPAGPWDTSRAALERCARPTASRRRREAAPARHGSAAGAPRLRHDGARTPWCHGAPKGAHRMFESVQPPPSEPGRFRSVLKLFALRVLLLLLLIPVNQLLGLVRERSSRRNEVRQELAHAWGGEQTLGALV